MRALRALCVPLLGLVVLSFSGCLYLHGHRILDPQYQEVKPDPENPRITGLARLMNDSSDDLVAVVFVHGGGFDPNKGYSEELRTALVKRLGVSTQPQCKGPFRVPSSFPADFSMCQYMDGVHRPLRFYELYWEPVWRLIWTANLKFDDDNKLGRLWLNHYAKEQLLNERFAEEVLYGGKFRKEMLRPVSYLLCVISNDAYVERLFGAPMSSHPAPCPFLKEDEKSRPKRIVAVGMSLGSVMLIDGIAYPLPEGRRAAGEVMKQMQALFMLSNQLPVSRLADIRAFPSQDEPEPAVSPEFVKLLQMRCERGDPHVALPSQPECPPLEIVAVTDPNDVVGYFIWHPQIPPDAGLPYAVWTNALVHNARWAVPWLAANPVNAHVDHAKNDDVIEIIACDVPTRC